MADPLSRIPDAPDLYKAEAKNQVAVCGLMTIRHSRRRGSQKPVQEAESLAKRIQQAYRQEPQFTGIKQQHGLQFQDGFWMRGTQVFVPNSVCIEICQLAHDHPSAGHFGHAKTLDLVQRYYWWPGMQREVQEFVDTCLVCQQSKYS